MAFGPPANVVVAVEDEEADECVTIVVLMGFSIEELERLCNSGLLDGPLMVAEPANGLPFSSTSINRSKNSFLHHLVHTKRYERRKMRREFSITSTLTALEQVTFVAGHAIAHGTDAVVRIQMASA